MSFSHLMQRDFPAGMAPQADLAALRERIRHIEQPASHGVLPFDVAAIDRALPGGGLPLGAVHEILGAGGDEEDGAAACGFIAGLLARLSPAASSPTSPQPSPPPRAERESSAGAAMNFPLRPSGGRGRGPSRQRWEGEVGSGAGTVLWCLKRPDLYGPGLIAHGLDPARLIVIAAPRDADILWAVEEGLRAPGLAAVVGEIGRLPMVAGRRLQLAAEHSGVTAFLLRRWRNGAEAAAERERPSAAVTRWRVAALPARQMDDPRLRQLIGTPCWRIELLRCRGGVPAEWEVEVADATGHVRLSAALADRPAAAVGQKEGRLGTEPLLRTG
ncbi:MAG: damage-inducible protein [Alphaproteobacteria bacterium]|nr:damage-inducible protein [Alphaproteobacteria bacterium]